MPKLVRVSISSHPARAVERNAQELSKVVDEERVFNEPSKQNKSAVQEVDENRDVHDDD